MPYSADQVKNKIESSLSAEHVDVEDVSDGCGAKFNAIIVCKDFSGKSLLQRHRMVNAAIAKEMESIHAFSQKTYTPEEWQKQTQQQPKI
ncbi:hypothetical protein HELRODRAFT_71473 [Helobdella robusta]|uniref:Uncharacterized protein n=1 Tax=Helobdella robusta TaxID=6412 RepID=T1G0M1_HELRO|nr:hypothetical protein HELRODRAFT_71473 [Helobdella robusta]ESO11646.1 hypothetical protein HELRODRAFT_71473 [Helobdella robusta]